MKYYDERQLRELKYLNILALKVLILKLTKLIKLTYGCQGKGTVRGSGMATYTLLYVKWTARTCRTAPGTLLSAAWQPGWESSLEGHGRIYMYDRVPLLFT